jgi:hypothetical protein
MAYFWLSDGTNTLELDLKIQELNLGGNKRNYKISPFAGSAGGELRGFGTVGSKTFRVMRKERVEGSDVTAWNSRRNDFQSWFTRPRDQVIYLYIKNGEGTLTVRTQIFCMQIGNDKYKNYRISDLREFEIVSPKGILENATPTTGSQAVILGDNTVTINNNGLWETPIIAKYTPTADESKFGARIADSFGFVLNKLYFNAGELVQYNTGNNSIIIDGDTKKVTQFLTGGGVFNLPPGETDLLVNVSGPGTFSYEFNERYS